MLVLGTVVLALQAAAALRAARTDLTIAKERTRALEFDEAAAALDRAEERVGHARARLGLFPIRAVGAVPFLGRSVDAVDRIAAAAAEVVAGGRAALSVSDQLPGRGAFRLSGGRFPRIDWPMVDRSARRAVRAFTRAEQLARAAPTSLVPGVIDDARAELLGEVEQARAAAQGLATGARILPGMLGDQGARHHLIVVQNLAEQRATGGAIEALLALRTDRGRFRLVRADGDEPVLGLPGDASAGHALNRDPHLPEVAPRIAERYRRATGIRADTLIAIDAHAIAHILRALGAIRVDGVDVNGDNAVRLLSEEIFRLYPTEEAQSAFLGAVTAETWSRLTGADLSIPDLLEQLGAAARRKHVLLWSRHRSEQRALESLRIAGVFPTAPAGGALLAVVGNQATPAELDAFTRRRLELHVELAEDGTARATLDVTVRHTARASEIPPLLLEKSPGGVVRTDLRVWLGGGDRDPLGRRLMIRPGTAETASFRSALSITPGLFRLLLFRQPSLRADTVHIRVVVPHGAEVVEAPPGARIVGRTVAWEGEPGGDRELLVRYR